MTKWRVINSIGLRRKEKVKKDLKSIPWAVIVSQCTLKVCFNRKASSLNACHGDCSYSG